MSFSSKVKKEVARHVDKARHCRIAEVTAIIRMCGQVEVSPAVTISIHTENPAVAKKFFVLIKETFNINPEMAIRKNRHLGKGRHYILTINNSDEAERILQTTKIIDVRTGNIVKGIHPLIVQSTCCKRAYIRGAFLGAGSVSDPEKNYHLELVNTSEEHCKDLQKIITCFDLDAKFIKRKKYHVLYLKDGTQIVDMLNIIGAHIALMDLENVRIVKEMRNNVNRIVNCETANLNKTVSAAVKQLRDIQFIESTIGIKKLPPNLEEVARIRMKYEDASLKELGTMLDPVVGKSGVNHRLRKISFIADKIRKEKEGIQ